MSLSKQELERFRSIRIHDILAIPYTGRKVSIKCPCRDHNDGTPSFLLDSDNGFYCFGCGAKGNGAIDFTMAVLECDFTTALQELKIML